MSDVQEIFAELNYPSAKVLKQVLNSRGIPFDNKEVDAIVKGEAVRQVQAPAPQSDGKIAADDLNDLWFADLIDLTAAPSGVGKKIALKPTDDNERYVLVVQRVFDRMLWTRALRSKKPKDVVRAFQEILEEAGAKPVNLTTDKGGEFDADFKRFVEAQGIKYKTKTSMRQISTLDVAIGNLKKAMVRDARKASTDDWADRLEKVTKGQNQIPKDYLDGKAPASVEGNEELQKTLEEKNSEYNKQNREAVYDREMKLRDAGYFRTMLDRPLNFVRGFKPKWSTKVHVVDTVDFDKVVDSDGKAFLTKFTLPVTRRGNEVSEPPAVGMEGMGSRQTEERKRRVLTDLADAVKAWLGQRTLTLGEVGIYLSRRGGFRNLAREARLNMSAPVVGLLKAFPELFDVATTSTGQSRVSAKRGELAFQGARRLRRISA